MVSPFSSVVVSLLVAKILKNRVGMPSSPGVESGGIPEMAREMFSGVSVLSSESDLERKFGRILLSALRASRRTCSSAG